MGNFLACIGRRNYVSGLQEWCHVCFQDIPKELRPRAALKLFELKIKLKINPQYIGPQFKQVDRNFLVLLDWFKYGDTKVCPVCGQDIAAGSGIKELIDKWT